MIIAVSLNYMNKLLLEEHQSKHDASTSTKESNENFGCIYNYSAV